MKKIFFKIIGISIIAMMFSCDNDPNPLDDTIALSEAFLEGSWSLDNLDVNGGSVSVTVDNGVDQLFNDTINYTIDSPSIQSVSGGTYGIEFNVGDNGVTSLVENDVLNLDITPETVVRATGGRRSLLPTSGFFATANNDRIESSLNARTENFESLFSNISGPIVWTVLGRDSVMLRYASTAINADGSFESVESNLILKAAFVTEDLIRFTYQGTNATPIFGNSVLSGQFVSGFTNADEEFITTVTFTPVVNNFSQTVSFTITRN